ncbi:MAG: U32 family peptidase [Desulfamplus sp.]|nr:U32 family peptidase [Desulfamplus sp.]MBF0390851.1 U32 family peptidase [Desulfamplus sp.]
MSLSIKKPELLAPAGNYEKLETAIHYGADAVYLGGKDFSLRNFSGNFTDDELESAVIYAHRHNVKIYITCNIFPRSGELSGITKFLEKIGNINADAVIISDPGIIRAAKEIIPHIDIHLSTQANTTNSNAVLFWHELGIKRVNLARELSLAEIKYITHNLLSNPKNQRLADQPNLFSDSIPIEIETFVHGAMCISYSGRCLLSSFLTQRDSNRGLCSHPCRWRYSVVEEQRAGEFQPVMEDERGTYIFNSKDMCMIDHIPELCDAKISSLKIEGRMKGISYLASVVKAYKEAIDSYFASPQNYNVKERWHRELELTYHREYSTGFYFNDPNQILPNYNNTHRGSIHSFIGKIGRKLSSNSILVEIKNRVSVGDTIEILLPKGDAVESKVVEIYDIKNNSVVHAQPNTTSILKIEPQYKTSHPSDLEENLTPLNIVRKIS